MEWYIWAGMCLLCLVVVWLFINGAREMGGDDDY